MRAILIGEIYIMLILATHQEQLRQQRDQLEEALHQAQADFEELSQQFNLLVAKTTEYEARMAAAGTLPPEEFVVYYYFIDFFLLKHTV